MEIINLTFQKKELSHSVNQSVATVLPEDSDERRNLKRYRPISLLNTDYRILTKNKTKL